MRKVCTCIIAAALAIAGVTKTLCASPVESDMALSAAEGFLAHSGIARRILGARGVAGVEERGNLWIAHLSPSGHIVMAGSTKCPPVVSFSVEDFTEPAADSPLYEKLSDADAWVAKMEADSTRADDPEWTSLPAAKPANAKASKRLLGAAPAVESEPYIAPLLDAAWYQSAPYNDLTPLGAPCGCMATAGGQEHRYWQWPWRYGKSRTVAHSLKDHPDCVIRVNGAVPFDYSAMLRTYPGEPTFRAADRRSTYECAYLILWMQSLVKMSFASGGSGGRQKLCAEARNHWFEQGNVMNKTRNGYDTLWQAIRDDLDFGSPIQVNTPGHQMVIDGYAIENAGADDEKDWVNINYGWGNPTAWADLRTEIESRQLADFQIGYRPQKRVQFEPVRKVNKPSFQFAWRIPNCYTNHIAGFTLQTAKLGGTTSFTDDFSASKGEEAGLKIENGYLAGYRGVQNSTYTYPGTHYATPGARLDFDVQYRYMRIHDAYVEARIDGGEWEAVCQIDMSDGLDRNDGFDTPVPQSVDLSQYAGKRIQLRFRLVDDRYAHWGTSAESDFRIDNVVLSGIKDADDATAETQNIAAAVDMPARYEATLENLESGASYAVSVTPLMKAGEEGAGAVASAFTTTIGEPAGDPAIESVSVVGAGLEILQDGFFAECGIGRVNPIVVQCANATALHAYPSHLSMLPDEKVSIVPSGLSDGKFTVFLDATEMDGEWHGNSLLLTLVAENADGTEAAKNLMLRFNSTRQILDGTFEVAEGGETDDPAWFCGDETVIDAKGKSLTFLGNAFMGSGNVTLVDTAGGGSFTFGGLDCFRGELKYGPDVAVTLPADMTRFPGTLVLAGETTLSSSISASASLILENDAAVALSGASLACPVTGSGTIYVSSGQSAITGSVGVGVDIALSGGRLDIAAGMESQVSMQSADAALWITIADIDVAFGYSSAVGDYSKGEIYLIDSEGNFLDAYIDHYDNPGAFTYDGTANTWTVADGETGGNYSDVGRWSLGRLPQDGEYAKIVNSGGTTIVLDAPQAVAPAHLRVTGGGAAMTFAAPEDGEGATVAATMFSNIAPVDIATALFQPEALEPQAAIALSGDACLESEINFSRISFMRTADLQNAAKWRGTTTVSGALPAPYNAADWFNPNLYGNAQSTVCFNGASGYLTVNTEFAPEIELVDNGKTPALDWNNGSSTSTDTFRSISGTGTFRTSSTALAEQILINDISGFTGSLDIRKKTVAIGEAMPEGDVISGGGRLFVDSAATIAPGKTWTAYDGVYLCDDCDLTVAGTLDADIVVHEQGATLNLANGGLMKISSLPSGEYSPALNFAAGTLRLGADMTLSKTVNFCASPTQEKWTTVDTQGHTLTLGKDFFSGTGDVLFSSPADKGGTVYITALPDDFTGTIILDGSTSVVFPDDGDLSKAACRVVVENTNLFTTPEKLGSTIVSVGGKVTIELDAKSAVAGCSVADKVAILAGGTVEFVDPDGKILATLTEAGANVAYEMPYNIWIGEGGEGSLGDVAFWSKGVLPAEGEDVQIYLFEDTTMTIPDDLQLDPGAVAVRGTGTLTISGTARDSAIRPGALANEIPVVIATGAFQPATLRPAAALEIAEGGRLAGDIDYANISRMRASDLQDPAKWNGTVVVASQMANFDSDDFGNASSRIRMNGASGFFAQNSKSGVALELVDGADGTIALNHDNGFGNHTVVIDKITGSGTYATTNANGSAERVLFRDVAEFTGSFDLNYKSVTLGAKLSTTDFSNYGRLFVRTAATIAPGAAWRANYGIWLGEESDLTVAGVFKAPITIDGAGAVLTLAPGGVIETASAIAARYAPALHFAAGTYRIAADIEESQTVDFCAAEGAYTTLDTAGHTLALGENFFSGSGDVLLASSDGAGTVVAHGISDAFTGRILIGENTTLRLMLDEKRTMLGFPGDEIEFAGGTIVIEDENGNILKESANDASYSNSQNFWHSPSGEGALLDPDCWTQGIVPQDGDDILVFTTQATTLVLDNDKPLRLGTVAVRGTGTLTISGTARESAILPAALANHAPVVIDTNAFQPEELKPQAALSFGENSDAMLDCVIRREYFQHASALLADARWRGDFIAQNATAENFPMHAWGNANSRIILSGVTGPAQNGNIEAEVVLVDSEDAGFAWNINPAPNRHVNIRKISGSGTLMASHTAASTSVTEFWDATEFSGSIVQGETGGGRIQVSKRQSNIWGSADQILVEPGFGIRLGDGKSWTPGTGGIALHGMAVIEGFASFRGTTTLYNGATLKFESLPAPSAPLSCENLAFANGTVRIAFGDGATFSDGQKLVAWQEGSPAGTFEFATLQENMMLVAENNALVVRAVEEFPEVDANTISNQGTGSANNDASGFNKGADTFTITIPATDGLPAGTLVRLESIALGTDTGYSSPLNVRYMKITGEEGIVSSQIVNGNGADSGVAFDGTNNGWKQTFVFDDDCLLKVGEAYTLALAGANGESVAQRFRMVKNTDAANNPIVQSATSAGDWRIQQEVSYRKVHTAKIADNARFAQIAFNSSLPADASDSFCRFIGLYNAGVALDAERRTLVGALSLRVADGKRLTFYGGDMGVARGATLYGGEVALDGAVLSVAGSLRLKDGATLRASSDATLDAAVVCEDGANAVVYVDEGATLTMTGRISGGGSIVKRGPGRLVLTYPDGAGMAYPRCEEGVVELGGAQVHSLGALRDFSTLALYVVGEGSSAAIVQTRLEYAEGSTIVANIPAGFEAVDIITVGGGRDAMALDGGVATYGDGVLRVDGDAATFDWEFNGNLASSGYLAHALTPDGGYNAAGSIASGGNSLLVRSHPYYDSNSHGYWTWAEEWTIAAKFAAPATAGTNVYALAIGNRGSGCIGLASCVEDGKMMLFRVANADAAFEPLLEFDVENRSGVQHLYTLSKSSGGNIAVYLDGVLKGEADISGFPHPAGTLQIGSLHGGITAAIGIAQPASGDDAEMDFLKVYNFGVSDAMRSKLVARYACGMCSVSWLDEDGTLLEFDEGVAFGQTPSYDGATPHKASSAEFEYEFAGWTPEISEVVADAVYTAVYNATRRSYTVAWRDEDGTMLETDTAEYGSAPSYDGAAPSKAEDAYYTYSFAGWSPEIATVTLDAAYTAVYTPHAKWTGDGTPDSPYALATPERIREIIALADDPCADIFVAEDGNITSQSILDELPEGYALTRSGIDGVLKIVRVFAIAWLNYDGGILLESESAYGTMPDYHGAEPARESTPEFDYIFAGWEPEVSVVAGDASYTAVFTEQRRSYTVTWMIDGRSETETYEYGQTPSHTAPVKESSAQFSYEFAGWDAAIVPVEGDAVYTAVFMPHVRSYTITWDIDGATETGTYEFGATPAHDTPVKPATAQYTYTFSGWSPEISAVAGDATYTARFESSLNSYTVVWLDDNGVVVDSEILPYGSMPSHGALSKSATAQYTYAFAGWSPEISAVAADAAYTAVFSSTVNEYDIVWRNDDGAQLSVRRLAYSAMPVYDGETPVKPSTAQFSYSFAGWDAAIVPVEGDAVYTAVFTPSLRSYPVEWLNDDGTMLGCEQVPYGQTPSYTGDVPAKASTAQFDYEFAGWRPSPESVDGPAAYTAVFNERLRYYTVSWLDRDGSLIEAQTLAFGETPSHDEPEDIHVFTGWSPEIAPVSADAAYTATFGGEIILSKLTGDYEAADGDVFTGETQHGLVIPGGAAVTVNGVCVKGAGGSDEPAPEPVFAENCIVETANFVLEDDGVTLVAFAELANAAVGADVTEDMVKVYSAETMDGLETALPLDQGVAVESKSAVKTTIRITAPQGAKSRFFRVEYGK